MDQKKEGISSKYNQSISILDIINSHKTVKSKYKIDCYEYKACLMNKWLKLISKIKDDLAKNPNTSLNEIFTESSLLRKKQKLKILTRLGIPDNLRGYIWQIFAGIDTDNSITKYQTYQKMLNDSLHNKKKESKDIDFENYENDIIKDLDRTSHSSFFTEKLGLGQRSLYNVLTTFSRQNEIGYVQGMSFFAACFLSYMSEEESYWMLYFLMEKYNMKAFYQKDFPELIRAYYQLLCLMKNLLPKIYKVLKNWNVYPNYYASQWFLTLFWLNVEHDIFLRIFDVFLYENHHKIIFRISLALLKINEDKIVNSKKFDDLMDILKNIGKDIVLNDLFKEAFKIKFSKKLLDEYGKQYDGLKISKGTDEFMEQLVH